MENVLCRLLKWKCIRVFPPRKMISVEKRKYAETRIVKLVQNDHGKDLEESCAVSARNQLKEVQTNEKIAKKGKIKVK